MKEEQLIFFLTNTIPPQGKMMKHVRLRSLWECGCALQRRGVRTNMGIGWDTMTKILQCETTEMKPGRVTQCRREEACVHVNRLHCVELCPLLMCNNTDADDECWSSGMFYAPEVTCEAVYFREPSQFTSFINTTVSCLLLLLRSGSTLA